MYIKNEVWASLEQWSFAHVWLLFYVAAPAGPVPTKHLCLCAPMQPISLQHSPPASALPQSWALPCAHPSEGVSGPLSSASAFGLWSEDLGREVALEWLGWGGVFGSFILFCSVAGGSYRSSFQAQQRTCYSLKLFPSLVKKRPPLYVPVRV